MKVFYKGFVARQLARKFIQEIFLRAPTRGCVTWCDVTKTNLCFHSILHVLHVSVWKGKYGSWLTLVNLEVSQICDHFNAMTSDCLPHDTFLTHLRAVWSLKKRTISIDCFRLWSDVLLITSSNFSYVRIVYCLSDHLILNHPQRWSAIMAVGRGFFDQYSVFCVFGSVVGCVVVPLITQVLQWRHALITVAGTSCILFEPKVPLTTSS